MIRIGESIMSIATSVKGDNVRFIARGVIRTGIVVRVKRDGTRTVKTEVDEDEDTTHWDVCSAQCRIEVRS